MYLHRFMERLSDRAYETNTVGEILELTLGEAVPAFEVVSLFSAFHAAPYESSLVLPVLVIAAFVLICAAVGVLLFLTGGRALRIRAFCNVTLFAGIGATFAPLLGLFLLRLQCCFSDGFLTADAQMQRVVMSLDALCIMGILICTLLPALASLRRLAAYAKRERDFVCFPYRFVAKRSFRTAKIMALIAVIGLIVWVGAIAFFPISTPEMAGDVSTIWKNLLKDSDTAITTIKALFTSEGGSISLMDIARILLGITGPLSIVFALLGLLCALLSLLGVLTVRRDSLLKKKRKRKEIKNLPASVRKTVFAPCTTFFVMQVVLCVLLLFFTPVTMHFDFSRVNDTLSVVYLTVAYLRTLGSVNTLYTLLAAAGVLLWHLADQAVAALIVRAAKE